ncbi:MAG: DUF5906 domain-containing protein [Sulfuricella sp.]|nr:DUF5906 domain-containing protein [Sulfuricella sp.]
MSAVLKAELAPDFDEARRFLSALDPAAASFTFQTFDDGHEPKNKRLSRILHGSFENHRHELARLNVQGAGVFVMVNKGDGLGRKADNVTGVRALFVDLDGSPLEPVLAVNVEPHIAVESSSSRFHAYWLAEGCPLERFTPLQEALAAKFDGDPKVKDLPRVMRLPGFWHLKGKPFQTRIIQTKQIPTYSIAQILEEFSAIEKSPFKQARTGLEQGARNDGVFRYASKLRGMGMAENEARELVLEAAACCIPPLDEAEALRCLESAWRYPAGINLTDTGNGQRLAARYGQDIRYSHALRKWLLWDTRWIFDDAGGIIVLAKDTARGIYIEAAQQTDDTRRAATAKHATASESLPRLTAMVELAKSEPGIPIRPDELDRDPMLLGVRNGTVNLLTGGLREPRREDYITKSAMTHYDPAADCPQWQKFLNRIMAGDPEMIGFLQRSIGYSLTGSTAEQCLFMLYGTGANGKSTFLNVLSELVGDYGANTPAESLMVQHNAGVRNDIARLRGVRFVTAIETEDGQRLAESLVKSLVGGDTISARFLYGEFFDFKPQFKLFLAANHKPIIKGDDYAIWRRVRLVPFEVTVPEAEWDMALPEKLRAELPGILNWAIEGCLEWLRTGLRAPAKVLAATAEYRGEMDFMQQFFDECCHIEPKAAAGATELYKAYQQWAEDNTGWCLSQTKFSLKLMERGFVKEKTPWIRYRGIGLRQRREDF